MITVQSATFTPAGFGRIELYTTRNPDADALDALREKRSLTAAAFKVASALEDIGAEHGFEFTVSAARATAGIIDVDFRRDGLDDDSLEQILLDACAACGLAPDGFEVGK